MIRIRNAEIIDRIVLLVEKHSENPKCMAMVEELVAIKCPEYEEVFEEQVGMPLSEYISAIRLYKAEKSLVNNGVGHIKWQSQFS
ncbi:hypothetical protein [Solibacillus merdavium]|uniref:HTH araC/xylS-type domain-containing protein n=1 Tax=Solibacillus merdavium TaxID=2762218 RepID=A0ABR8XPF2_9BACL|nr:hypothetical protein [Solibacillus merdavium]MBD8033817.1 hypothetical protein [Solibacillus merdavium]